MQGKCSYCPAAILYQGMLSKGEAGSISKVKNK
jgi:hypothetical protein